MKTKLQNNLTGQWENHIFPFFWQHGEDDETLLNELHRIYDSGIRSVCVEARPAPDFGKEPWFEDMALILAECKKLGMEFWLLDDEHFPTGRANGLLRDKYPHLGKHAVTERHVDVAGPVRDGAVMVQRWLGEQDTLIGVIACRRYPDSSEQRMMEEAVDLTSCFDSESGMLFFDLPEGFWRIFMLIDTPVKDDYIDMLRADSVHVLIEAVYEPHYERFSEYFGTTFRGYFSDEPFIMRDCKLPMGDENRSKAKFPWNDNVREGLLAAYGENWLKALPNLWFPGDGAAKLRVAYMDTVTKLYRECFCNQLGDWCRAHGAEYIGHIIEDNNSHTSFISGAHFFRALDGQDMAGIDVVLCQIVPGMMHNTIAVPCSYDKSDSDFFHFGLAKLGSSHAHIQPLKKGRAMCEIYGAYGWAEGLPMMKWLTDHMLVRGINQYVPHAFSPRYPDFDCPPHFYNGGHNPEYRPFGKLMGYMNRVTSLLNDGLHHASAALYYHAQAEWSGGEYMFFQKPARVLTEHQIDFDVIPEDYLAKCCVKDGVLRLNGETYRLFVLPYAQSLPGEVIERFAQFAREGLPVWCIEKAPSFTCEGDTVPESVRSLFCEVPLDRLAGRVREEQLNDVLFEGENAQNLRVYHYSRNGMHGVLLTNEGINGAVCGTIAFRDFAGGRIIRYDPMENLAWYDEAPHAVPVSIDAYGSVMLFFGDIDGMDLLAYQPADDTLIGEIENSWQISFAEPEDYDPLTPDFRVFRDEETGSALYNIVRKHKKFAGFVRYETTLHLAEDGVYTLDLGQVGEAAWVYINGEPAGDRIIPPYRFEIRGAGETALTVVTVSHLGYRVQDGFSAYLRFDPVGLLGPVKLYRHNG